MNKRGQVLRWFTCSCGKRAYITKKEARDAIKRVKDKTLHVYPCTENPDYLHVGHTAPGIPRWVYRERDYQRKRKS